MKTIHTGGVPIQAWVDGVEFDDTARRQLERTARLPFVYHHVAVMPDVHAGIGATVGSVVATRGAIVPAAVGVDVGCGMVAQRTSLRAEDLPDNLRPVREALERAISVGFGMHQHVPASVTTTWETELEQGFAWIREAYPQVCNRKEMQQLGTLGAGNHLIEVEVDEEGFVWVMLHSGSRGIGNKIGTYFIEEAKRHVAQLGYGLEDRELSWLDEGTKPFEDYVRALGWAQHYARANRTVMMQRALDALRKAKVPAFELRDVAVNCHHNYVALERHFGADVYVTRKGAVRAGKGELGIIPGSMGARSYIVRGKGNAESFESCSHGAGRRMSRNEARRSLTVADLERQTEGVECRKDAGVLDEAPAAYKNIDAVMKAQRDLVSIVHAFKQVVCIKG